jgi:hypothetical protein
MTNAVSPNDPDTSALAAILFGELEAALFTQLIHAVGRAATFSGCLLLFV